MSHPHAAGLLPRLLRNWLEGGETGPGSVGEAPGTAHFGRPRRLWQRTGPQPRRAAARHPRNADPLVRSPSLQQLEPDRALGVGLGNTIGPWFGGLTIDAGLGYRSVCWLGAGLSLAALGTVGVSAALSRTPIARFIRTISSPR